MGIKPKTQVHLYLILAITLFWVLCGAFLAVYKCVTYDTISEEFIFIVPKALSLSSFVLINLIGPAIGGLIGGSFLVLVLNEQLRNRSYGYFLTVNILFFFVFIFTLNTAVSYFFYYKNDINENDFHEAIRLLVLDPYAIRNIATWMIIAFLTLQGLKIYEKYGPGTLLSMLLGKYHRPREVQRVFMFLDLSNSTTVAEQLGHVRFFALLRDFYTDITDPILNSQGEIYQYVGDEVVISWTMRSAIAKEPNCIACFFHIEDVIHHREQHYKQEYGLTPGFKASVHKGTVVVGEMGVIKREIVYSGDILNTASRMMEQCKIHQQKLIISQEVVDLVPSRQLKQYMLDPLGNLSLRGKAQSVELYGIRRKGTLLPQV